MQPQSIANSWLKLFVATLQPTPLYRAFHHVYSFDRHFCGTVLNLTDETMLFSSFYWCSFKVEWFHCFELALALSTAHSISFMLCAVDFISYFLRWSLLPTLSSAQCNAADQDLILCLIHFHRVENLLLGSNLGGAHSSPATGMRESSWACLVESLFQFSCSVSSWGQRLNSCVAKCVSRWLLW